MSWERAQGTDRGWMVPTVLWNLGHRAGSSEPRVPAWKLTSSVSIPGPRAWLDSMRQVVLGRFPWWSPASRLRALIPHPQIWASFERLRGVGHVSLS